MQQIIALAKTICQPIERHCRSPPDSHHAKGPIAITFIADPDGIINEMFGVWNEK